MTPEQWEKVGELYHAALELEPAHRAAFLAEACADEALRCEVASLLEADAQAGDLFASSMAPLRPLLAQAKATGVQAADSQSFSLTGNLLGHYQILEPIGKGGMGKVYLARDSKLGRQVALKLLPAAFSHDAQRVRRFEREARTVSALNHPNIITIHEVGRVDDAHFLVMEFIDGQTLRHRLASGSLALGEALEIVAQVANALVAAHAAGIVHRDIKPENVMIRRDGLVKVLDFGLAKLTQVRPVAETRYDTNAPTEFMTSSDDNAVLGTPRYMSPEQARGLQVDGRTDLFSLGTMLYEMLTGRQPFNGETPMDVILAVVSAEPPPLTEVLSTPPPALLQLVNKTLCKNRDERYQTAQALLLDVKQLQQQLGSDVTWQTLLLPAAASENANTKDELTIPTDKAAAVPTLSTAILLGWLKRRARVGLILAAVALLVAALAYVWWPRPVLTARDTVLLAEFENKTGEEVFDVTLRQALAVQLEQSPFLNLFSDDRVRETLRYMGRQPDARVTRDIAREICQRQALKALLVGSIARLERHYSIILEAINSQTGEVIASALAEANGKDQVLQALGRAGKQLREQLGESLATLQKFDAPLEQATTPSLEAFKAWARGVELSRSGNGLEAIPLYEHAKALDPNFARADVSLSQAYSNLGQLERAAEYADKAFVLREQVTEREKFDIASNYHSLHTGDLLAAIQVVELWRQTYPRDYGPRARLASLYRLIGQPERGLAAAREAEQLNPRAYVPRVNQGTALVLLNRFADARRVIEEAIAQQLATATSRRDLFQIAFWDKDRATMQQQLDALTGKPDEYWALHWQAQAASFNGQMRQAAGLYRRAAVLAEPQNRGRAARFLAESALRSASYGQCSAAKVVLPAEPARISLQSYVPTVVSRALALALCGEVAAAQGLIDEIAARNPQSTLANFVWLPVLRAVNELQRNHPEEALRLLETTRAYEPAAEFWAAYLRGQAFLRLGKNAEAEREFQAILAHRGWDLLSSLYPLATLGLARAQADPQKRAAAYQEFLSLWQEADADLPILRQAKAEFARK